MSSSLIFFFLDSNRVKMRTPRRMYHKPHMTRRRRGALQMQRIWRGYRARRTYLNMKKRRAANQSNEVKHTYQFANLPTFAPGTLNQTLLMSTTGTGATGFADIIGTKCWLRGSQMMIRIAAQNPNSTAFVRILLVRKLVSTGDAGKNLFRGREAAIGEDFNLGVPSPTVGYTRRIHAPINKRKYQVLYDRKLRLVKNQAANTWNMNYRIFNTPYIKINRTMTFNGQERTANDINPNYIWLLFTENSSGDITHTVNISMEIYTYFSG